MTAPETVWVVAKTPQQRNTPTVSHVFDNEPTAQRLATAYRRDGWNVSVDSFTVRSDMTAAAKAIEERGRQR